MTQRGRKSAKLLTVIGPHGLEPIRRPEPPGCLNVECADEWRAVVGAMAADYFRPETLALLEQRCRHIVWARRLAQLIEAEELKEGEGFDDNRYRGLLRIAAVQSHAIAALDTKLRLTQESVYDRTDQKPAAKRKPWEAA
jgi:hypothetical protein